MKVKKLLAAGLAAAMMLGTLAGCGGGKENSGGNTGGEDSKIRRMAVHQLPAARRSTDSPYGTWRYAGKQSGI